jgi:hypothetical protein
LLGYFGVVLREFPQGMEGVSYDPLRGTPAIVAGLVMIGCAIWVLDAARRVGMDPDQHAPNPLSFGRRRRPSVLEQTAAPTIRTPTLGFSPSVDSTAASGAPSTNVTIIVRDARGGLLADADIVLEVSTGERGIFRAEGRTTSDGMRCFQGVPFGSVKVQVSRADEVSGDRRLSAFEIAESGNVVLEVDVVSAASSNQSTPPQPGSDR